MGCIQEADPWFMFLPLLFVLLLCSDNPQACCGDPLLMYFWLRPLSWNSFVCWFPFVAS